MQLIHYPYTILQMCIRDRGEKLQKVLAMEDVSLNQILDVNETVMNMVTTVNELEHTLRDKLEFISNNLYYLSLIHI